MSCISESASGLLSMSMGTGFDTLREILADHTRNRFSLGGARERMPVNQVQLRV